MIDVLFIGSNPSLSSKSNDAFNSSTKSRKTLDSWSSAICLSFDRIAYYNISDAKTINNKALSKNQWVAELDILKNKIDKHKNCKIVTLGNTADKALTLLGYDHYNMPHPSGRNRLLNDKAFLERKLSELKSYIEGTIS